MMYAAGTSVVKQLVQLTGLALATFWYNPLATQARVNIDRVEEILSCLWTEKSPCSNT